MEYRATKLNADTIDFDQATQILDAQGNPDVQDPQIAPLKGRRLKYNLKSKIGAVYHARSYKAGEYYRGAEVRRLSDKTLQVIDGDYCKCQNVEVPDYYFATAKMEIEPERQATAAPVVLNVEEVPVLVAPFVLFPLGKGRRSGLLTPKLGGDQKQGFFARNLGAYWGISDYMDLTTVTDVVEGSGGRFDQLNGDATFRYARRYWLTGTVQGKKYLRELGDAGSGWEVRYDHNQELLPQPDKFTLKGSGSFVSSATVRSTNALTASEILDQTANANLATTYKWDKARATLIVSASQQENLRTGIRDRELPSVSFSASDELIPREDVDDTAWYKSLNYSYSNQMSAYSYRSADSISRAQWDRYNQYPDSLPRPAPHDQEYLGGTQKLNLGLSKPIGHLNLSTAANVQHDWSGRSYTEPANSTGAWRAWSDNMDPDNVITWNARTDASTNIYGTWLPYWGRFMGLRHTLTPSAGYQYVPKIDSHKFFVPHPRLGQRVGQDKAQLLNLSLGQQLDTKIMDALGMDTTK
ncbi:MAG TPA: putative LPS assembly protein LptD, partial [Fibrobacteria bacterium]|nr:putative LPS assembly protein LptD [Fibrobacteria bacterium]